MRPRTASASTARLLHPVLIAIAVMGGGCAEPAETGLRLQIKISGQLLDAGIGTLRVTLDTPKGFSAIDPPLMYQGGEVIAAARDVDGDNVLEAVIDFNQGYAFAPTIIFRARTDNRDDLEIAIDALVLNRDGRRIGAGHGSAPATRGKLQPVEILVKCVRLDDCAPDGVTGSGPRTIDLLSTGELSIVGPLAGHPASVMASCDLNGDGHPDLVIGVPTFTSAGAESAGAVFVVFGAPAGWGPLPDPIELPGAADFAVTGAAAGDALGSALACGDLNGDGHDDLAIGAPAAIGLGSPPGVRAGRVYLVPGKDELRGSAIDLARDLPADTIQLIGASAGDLAGSAVLIADLDGDALADLAVAAPGQGAAGRPAGSGAVHLFAGRSVWSSPVEELGAESTHTTIAGAPGSELAAALAAGDINNDGKPDLILGAPRAYRASEQEGSGAVIVFGNPPLAHPIQLDAAAQAGSSAPSLVVWGPESGSAFGRAVAAADLSKDGRADLLVGAPLAASATGQVFLIEGDASLLGQAPAAGPIQIYTSTGGYKTLFRGEAAGDQLGAAIATTTPRSSLSADLIIGAPGASPAERPHAGAVYRIHPAEFGPVLDLSDAAVATQFVSLRVIGEAAQARLGTQVAGGWIDRDANGDLLATESGAQNQRGVVRVLFGP